MREAINEISRRVADPIVFGNFFIAFCAASLVEETYILLGYPLKFNGLTFFVFFSTLALYNFHRLIGIRRIKTEDHGLITGWASRNQFPLLMLTIVGLGGAGFFLFQLPYQILFILIPLTAISLFYELPLVKYDKRFQRLRNLWLSKAFLITIVWALTTALLPAINVGHPLNDYEVWIIVSERIIFIMILALCFDARDVEFDSRDSLKTIPIVYGLDQTKKIIKILCTVFFITTVIHYVLIETFWGAGIAMMLSIGLTWLTVIRSFPRRSDYYYMFVVDGMMIAQFLLILLLRGLK